MRFSPSNLEILAIYKGWFPIVKVEDIKNSVSNRKRVSAFAVHWRCDRDRQLDQGLP